MLQACYKKGSNLILSVLDITTEFYKKVMDLDGRSKWPRNQMNFKK